MAGLTEGAAFAGETGQFDLEYDTGTIWAGQGVDVALHVTSIGVRALGKGSVRKSCLVHGPSRVLADDCSISEFLWEELVCKDMFEEEYLDLTNASALSRDAGGSQDGGGD